jgi:hypothetical protein
MPRPGDLNTLRTRRLHTRRGDFNALGTSQMPKAGDLNALSTRQLPTAQDLNLRQERKLHLAGDLNNFGPNKLPTVEDLNARNMRQLPTETDLNILDKRQSPAVGDLNALFPVGRFWRFKVGKADPDSFCGFLIKTCMYNQSTAKYLQIEISSRYGAR